MAYMWYAHSKIIKKSIVILLILGIAGIINTPAEGPAMRWGIWFYNEPKTLGISILGAKLETYIFCILVPIAIGTAAIIFAEMKDKSQRARKRT